MLQLFNFLNPFVEAFFFSFFVEVALPLVPDLEYFKFLLIVVAFGRFFLFSWTISNGQHCSHNMRACNYGWERTVLFGISMFAKNNYTEYTTHRVP